MTQEKELEFWKNHLARLYVIKAQQLMNKEDFSHTQRRIENAEHKIEILLTNEV